jgi:CRISPR system Cascade subunit CasB
MNQPTKHPFISYLESLAISQERGALAALRRGLGQPPGTAAEMFRYVVPWLPQKAGRAQEAVYYLIASLFALHPQSTEEGNLGAHLARTRSEGGEEALERRFTALLAAHPDDLPFYLRQAVSFLKSKEIAVNWNQLLRDLQNWDHPDRFVQKAWAGSFWGKSQAISEP